MENKITFDIGAQIIQTAESIPQFQKVRLQIVCPGDNLHHMPISELAIENAIPSLVGKPILCHYKSQRGGEFGGHDPEQIPVGVVLNRDDIFYEEIDGKKWLCCYAYLWARYFESIIDVFKKNDGKSKLSMEIDLLEFDPENSEILSFMFAGISLIGVPEAIPGANAELVFSQIMGEFEHDKQILFSSQSKITHFPVKGKNLEVHLKNSQYPEFDYDYATALKAEYPSVWNKGGNLHENFGMWTKAHSEDSSPSTQDWIREREQWGKRHNRDKSIAGVIAQVKMGMVSDHGIEYMKSEIEKSKSAHDNSNRAYFDEGGNPMPYSKLGDINPSLKGIDPPISLGQANAIAKQADAVGSDKGGWGIAIKHFKDSHEVKDGKWVEKNVNSNKEVKEKMADEKDEKDKVEMAATPPEDKKAEEKKEAKETPEEEKAETPAEAKKEEEEGTEKPVAKKAKMSEYADMEKMSKFMADSEFAAEFAAEAGKEDDVDFAVVVRACYSAMCKMSEKFDASEKDKNAYMAKMQEYEARFAELEKQKFSIEVESQLQEVSDVLSKDEIEECRTDSVNFSMENVDGWKNKVKALGVTKTKNKKSVDTVVKYALPFHNEPENTEHLLFKGGNK